MTICYNLQFGSIFFSIIIQRPNFDSFILNWQKSTSLEKINSGLIPSLASFFLFGIKNIKTKCVLLQIVSTWMKESLAENEREKNQSNGSSFVLYTYYVKWLNNKNYAPS